MLKDLKFSTRLAAAFGLLAAALAPAVQAGRPLATDDAATAEVGSCYVESWFERAGPERALLAAPACGVASGLELGGGYAAFRPRTPLRAEAGLLIKLAPESWKLDSAVGEWRFGLRLDQGFEQTFDEGWQRANPALYGLVTLQPTESVALHFNLATEHDRASGTRGNLTKLAAVWSVREDSLLFVETEANNRRDVFGATATTVGGRHWLTLDRFGIDLTATRSADADSRTRWTIGFGWYGIGL